MNVNCPKCQGENVAVVDTRTGRWMTKVPRLMVDMCVKYPSRIRKCNDCGERWVTHEMSREDMHEFVRGIRAEVVSELSDIMEDWKRK